MLSSSRASILSTLAIITLNIKGCLKKPEAIRQQLQQLPSGSTINLLIFTQVKVCPECRSAINAWVMQLQQAAPPGVRVNFYIWQKTNFDIDHPTQTPVASPDEVELAVSASAL